MSATPPSSPRAGSPHEMMHSARLYLCMDARRHLDDQAREQGFSGAFPALRRDAEAAVRGGVDIIQLRDKNSPGQRASGAMEAREELEALAVLREVCHEHGALMAVNDRADIAAASGADVLHVGQGDLPPEVARSIVGDGPAIGLSCHSDEEVDAALANPYVDYFCTGPVWPTPTKPGRFAPGLSLVRHAAGATQAGSELKPWFAIGGIDAANLHEVLEAGANRIVVVRAITDAADLSAAAGQLREEIVATTPNATNC